MSWDTCILYPFRVWLKSISIILYVKVWMICITFHMEILYSCLIDANDNTCEFEIDESNVLSLKKWFVDMTLIRYNVEIKCLVTCSKYAELLGISQIRWLWSRDTLKMSFIEKSIVHKHRIIADQRNLWIQFWVNRFSYSLLISFDFLCSLVLFPLKNCLLHFANLSTPSLIWTLVRLSCNSQVNLVFINVTFAIAFINDFCSDFAYDYDSFKCKCSLGTHFTDRLCYISVVWLKWWRDNKKTDILHQQQ